MRQLLRLAIGTFCILSATLAFGDAQPRCFKNIGLRDTIAIRLWVEADKVRGGFAVEDDAANQREYPFTGNWRDNRITVNFPGDRVPPILGKKRPIVWTLRPSSGGAESLRISIYGQNYNSKKFSTYDITLEHCQDQDQTQRP